MQIHARKRISRRMSERGKPYHGVEPLNGGVNLRLKLVRSSKKLYDLRSYLYRSCGSLSIKNAMKWYKYSPWPIVRGGGWCQESEDLFVHCLSTSSSLPTPSSCLITASGIEVKLLGAMNLTGQIRMAGKASENTKMICTAMGREGNSIMVYVVTCARPSVAHPIPRDMMVHEITMPTHTTTIDKTNGFKTTPKMSVLVGEVLGFQRSALCLLSRAPMSFSSDWTQTSQRPMSVDSHVLDLFYIRD